MKKSQAPHRTLRRAALCAGALLVLSSASAAITWHDVQIGGFVSQGYLANDGPNDYLGDTSEGTFDFREYALNASWSKGKFRIGAQAFGQELGKYGNDKISLDWGIVDYQAAQWFGVRAGRVKMPRGLYNEALDVDSVRPFVLLPQSVYDARLRDFNSAFNGGMIYGNISLKKLGSLDYRVFIGEIPISTDSGASDYFNNDAPYPNVRLGMDSVVGGSLFWNTPVSGLRLGYSYSVFNDFFADRQVVFPASEFGPAMELVMYKSTPQYHRDLLSAEYVTGDWVFAGEVGWETTKYDIGMYEFPDVMGRFAFDSFYGYVSAARRINDRFEVGTYYSHSIDQQDTIYGAPFPIRDLIQDDYAFSVRYDATDHLVIKAEVHFMEGAGKLFDLPSKPQPTALRDESWTLIALKATYSF